MNGRESSIKVSKNQFRAMVNDRIAAAKRAAEPEPPSLDEQRQLDALAAAKAVAKAIRFASWLEKKAERKRLRSKYYTSL
jgi:hypothetical protein